MQWEILLTIALCASAITVWLLIVLVLPPATLHPELSYGAWRGSPFVGLLSLLLRSRFLLAIANLITAFSFLIMEVMRNAIVFGFTPVLGDLDIVGAINSRLVRSLTFGAAAVSGLFTLVSLFVLVLCGLVLKLQHLSASSTSPRKLEGLATDEGKNASRKVPRLAIWKAAGDPAWNGRGVLRRLDRDLDREHLHQTIALRKLPRDTNEADAFARYLVMLTQLRSVVHTLSTEERQDNLKTREQLRGLAKQMSEALEDEPWNNYGARVAMARTIHLLIKADSQLVLPELGGPAAKRIVIPTDLLYQAHHSLFPAERMLVVSGHTSPETTILGAVFEVTGENSFGHVKADPSRLARALIAMDLSDTFLAAWWHSHPGIGAGCAQPSSTDLNQHQDWIRDYTPNLLSAIIVADGWIRFWGTALESRQIDLELTGRGITREDEHDHIYRLAS